MEGVGASREAELATDSDGEPLGVCLYLTPAELKASGVNPETADSLKYSVEEGSIVIEEAASAVVDQ